MINFVITEVCNWECEYCLFPKIKNKKHTSIEKIEKHYRYINEIIKKLDFPVSVQGGEIGLVPVNILECFFSKINKPIDVSTNGEFLKRNIHNNPIIKSKINKILLHVTNNIQEKININFDIENSICGIVDISNNPIEIKKFIEKNKHIYFEYIDYDNGIYDEIKPHSHFDLYEAIKNLNNVSNWAKERLTTRFDKNLKECQNQCMRLHPCIFVDLVNEKIPLCIRNYNTVYKELNKENLIETIKGINSFDYTNNTCKSCIRICKDEGIGLPQIKNKMLYRRKL